MPSGVVVPKLPSHAAQQRAFEQVLEHSRALAELSSLTDKQLACLLDARRGRRRSNSLRTLSAASAVLARLLAVLKFNTATASLDGALSQARLARLGAIARKEVLPSGEMVGRLGITRQALNKAVHSNRIFVVEFEGKTLYPRFFVDPTLDRTQLGRVVRALGDLPGWDKYIFLTTAKLSLQKRTPLEALRRGMLKRVLVAAAGYAAR